MRIASWWAAGIALAALTAMVPGPARAATVSDFQARTTGEMVQMCDPAGQTPLDALGVAFCQGFAQGAVSVEMQHGSVSGIPMFCLPDPLPKRSEVLSGFVRWARAEPARLAPPPEESLFAYLIERFPCPVRR